MLFSLRANICKISSNARKFSVVTTAMVKELRERTGAPMMECKKALSVEDVNGDIAKAIDYLRAKGIARAANSASRTAEEGLVGVFSGDKCSTLIEVNSETDFVSRNEEFQKFVSLVARTVNSNAPAGEIKGEEILKLKPVGSSLNSLQEELGEIVLKIRENIVIRRACNVTPSSSEVVASYVHGKVGAEVLPSNVQLGRACSLVQLSSTAAVDSLQDAAKKLAMHVVAAKPQYLSSKDVPVEVIEKEKAIFREQQSGMEGKKPEVLERILLGKVTKRLSEICLMDQNHFAEEGAPVVSKFFDSLGKSLNAPISVKSYYLWSLNK